MCIIFADVQFCLVSDLISPLLSPQAGHNAVQDAEAEVVKVSDNAQLLVPKLERLTVSLIAVVKHVQVSILLFVSLTGLGVVPTATPSHVHEARQLFASQSCSRFRTIHSSNGMDAVL